MKNIFLLIFTIIFIVGCKNTNEQNNLKDYKLDKNKKEIQNTNSELENNDMNTTKQNIEFSDLFNEGSIIEFSPKDLEATTNNEQLEFKKKLELYEKQNPIIEDFDPENLKLLINVHIYSNKDYSNVDSSWLDYFIKKYSLLKYLNNIMIEAINNEDFEAVKIIISNGYVISRNDLTVSSERKLKVDEIINKKSDEDFYETNNSKINDIIKLLTKKYNSNKIYDNDGYTNLRDGKGSNFSVIEKINSGEHIKVLDNPDEEDWYLVQTKDDKKGYVHKSRIKSE